jgi:hypothetical protein
VLRLAWLRTLARTVRREAVREDSGSPLLALATGPLALLTHGTPSLRRNPREPAQLPTSPHPNEACGA